MGPVPFGGSDQELQRLDIWLANANAPSRLLITAPAGRGKSALLVRWIVSLQERKIVSKGGWPLIFLPISIRVGTNAPEVFYQVLAGFLADIVGATLETPATDAAIYYADQARDLLGLLAAFGMRIAVFYLWIV
jgi:ATP/maltotriose-dependent transcriptional regulator MalT